MYAIALHDPAAGQLILTRDPFGIKPLYYAETPSAFAFASEPGALIEAGIVTPQLVPSVRNELVQMQFTTGRETIFAGINRVLPGETVVVRRGRIVERRRRAALPEGGPLQLGEEEALARLDVALMDSVRLHQRSDVPFGVFLSGGIDSTAVLAMMARLAERPVKAFTIGFAAREVTDERPAARAAAASVGAEHVELVFDEADFWKLPERKPARIHPHAKTMFQWRSAVFMSGDRSRAIMNVKAVNTRSVPNHTNLVECVWYRGFKACAWASRNRPFTPSAATIRSASG